MSAGSTYLSNYVVVKRKDSWWQRRVATLRASRVQPPTSTPLDRKIARSLEKAK